MVRAALVGGGLVICAILLVAIFMQRRETERMKAELADLHASVARSQSTSGGSPVTPGPGPSGSLPDPALVRADRDVRRKRVYAVIEQGFQQESPDPAWSAEAEGQIDRAVSTLPDAKMVSRACRATLCRVVVSHESPGSQRQFTKQISHLPPFDNRVVFQPDFASVPITTTMYLARAGHQLPRASD
jgi:hypothetical protein